MEASVGAGGCSVLPVMQHSCAVPGVQQQLCALDISQPPTCALCFASFLKLGSDHTYNSCALQQWPQLPFSSRHPSADRLLTQPFALLLLLFTQEAQNQEAQDQEAQKGQPPQE